MKKVALVIGHRLGAPGAKNPTTGTTEFGFNEGLAIKIKRILDDSPGIETAIIYRESYGTLPAQINALKPDFIISLHCNAYDCKTSGTEVLYYHQSDAGRKMAETLQRHLVKAIELRDRGIKGVTSEDRGGDLLTTTCAPCIIAEPFFIDNDNDIEIVREKQGALIAAYAQAIIDIAAGLEAEK